MFWICFSNWKGLGTGLLLVASLLKSVYLQNCRPELLFYWVFFKIYFNIWKSSLNVGAKVLKSWLWIWDLYLSCPLKFWHFPIAMAFTPRGDLMMLEELIAIKCCSLQTLISKPPRCFIEYSKEKYIPIRLG